jgi:hypothetical protein
MFAVGEEKSCCSERECMVYQKEWVRSVKEGGTCSGRNGVALVGRSRTAGSVFDCVRR